MTNQLINKSTSPKDRNKNGEPKALRNYKYLNKLITAWAS